MTCILTGDIYSQLSECCTARGFCPVSPTKIEAGKSSFMNGSFWDQNGDMVSKNDKRSHVCSMRLRGGFSTFWKICDFVYLWTDTWGR